MSTLNGIGTRFLGISMPQEDQTCNATLWITCLYLPIVPLFGARLKMIRSSHDFLIHRLEYELISKQPLSILEVFKTYLFGWILFPLFLLWPFLLVMPEVKQILGISLPNNGLLNPGAGDYLFLFGLVWLVVLVWKLKDWDEKRGFPPSKSK